MHKLKLKHLSMTCDDAEKLGELFVIETLTVKLSKEVLSMGDDKKKKQIVKKILSDVEKNSGSGLDIKASDISKWRENRVLPGGQPNDDTCTLCDSPKDACKECDAADGWTSCILCDEGDPCGKCEVSCETQADTIPCWKPD